MRAFGCLYALLRHHPLILTVLLGVSRLLDLDGRSTWCKGVDYGHDGKKHWFSSDDRPALERLFSNLRMVGHDEGLTMVLSTTDMSYMAKPGCHPHERTALAEKEEFYAQHTSLRSATYSTRTEVAVRANKCATLHIDAACKSLYLVGAGIAAPVIRVIVLHVAYAVCVCVSG